MYLELREEYKMLEEFETLLESTDVIDDEAQARIDEAENALIQAHTNSLQAIERSMRFVKFLQSQEVRLKSEEQRLKAQRDWAVHLSEKIKAAIADYVKDTGEKTITAGTFRLGLRKSTGVKIIDETIIPADFLVRTVVTRPDKKKIKETIKSGTPVTGAALLTKENLSVR